MIHMGNKAFKCKDNKGNNYYPTPYFPIGFIYTSLFEITTNELTNLFGGEWEQIKDTFLLACGDNYSAGSTGGEAKHTLTVDEMPSHTHNIPTQDGQRNSDTGSNWSNQGWNVSSVTKVTSSTGGGQAHNNMPPYITVYMYYRKA